MLNRDADIYQVLRDILAAIADETIERSVQVLIVLIVQRLDTIGQLSTKECGRFLGVVETVRVVDGIIGGSSTFFSQPFVIEFFVLGTCYTFCKQCTHCNDGHSPCNDTWYTSCGECTQRIGNSTPHLWEKFP